jgi:hypothetical protein
VAAKLESKDSSKEIDRRQITPESQQSCEEDQESIKILHHSSLPHATTSEDVEDIHSVEENDALFLCPLVTQMPTPPESVVDSIDLPYLHYFMLEWPSVHPYTSVFPTFPQDLMRAAASVVPLRHSIISLAAIVADTVCRRPIVRALHYHHLTIRKIQDTLSSVGGINEPIIYAVMMLTYFNLYSGRFLSARRHVRGVYLLLQSYSSKGRPPSTTTMLIWRSALRMDYFLSSVYPCKPIFPTPPAEQEDFHLEWIRTGCTPTGEEWAIAQFALDNLQSRAAHLSWDAYESRRSGNPAEIEIQTQVMTLLNDFSTWRGRKLFLEEDELEKLVETYRPSLNLETFLDYPSMSIRNAFYANLLNEYRCAVLFITFIAYPLIGQISPFETLRQFHAIDCCRSIGATGINKFPVPMVRILQLAGLVFADKARFQDECDWIETKLDEIAERGMQAAKRVKEMLGIVWNSAYPWTYEETERVMQSPGDLEQLDLEEMYDEVAK